MYPLKLGIISTARINDRCIFEVIKEVPDVHLCAVASRTEERAKEYSRRHAIPRAYGSYEALLCDADLDAVYISAPNVLHAALTCQALMQGKHVLCEKPLSDDPKQALVIEELARKQHLYVAEAMHYRHHPAVRELVSAIRSGLLGELKHISISFVWDLRDQNDIRLKSELAGGALMDVGCYCLDFIRWITGDNQPEIRAAQARWSDVDAQVDTALRCALLCSNGIQVKFYCDLHAEAFDCRAEMSGTHGSLLLRYPFLPVLLRSETADVLFACETDTGYTALNVPSKTSYLYQLEDFKNQIQNSSYADAPMRPGFYYNAALIAAIKDRVRSAGSLQSI